MHIKVGAALLKSVNHGDAWQHLQQEQMNHCRDENTRTKKFACSNQRKQKCAGSLQSQLQKAAKNYKNTIGGDQITHEPLKISDIMKRQYISNQIQKVKFLYFEVYRLNSIKYVKICLCEYMFYLLQGIFLLFYLMIMPILSHTGHLNPFFCLRFFFFFATVHPSTSMRTSSTQLEKVMCKMKSSF